MRAREIAVLALVVLSLCAGAVVALVSWESAQKLVHPERRTALTTPDDLGIAYEEVQIGTIDGFLLAGWWMPAQGEAKGAVVFLHGYGEDKNQSLGFAAPLLHNASYHVLAIDLRAHGASEGKHTTVGLDEVEDVRAAFAYVAKRTGDAQRTVLMGFSMGAATAINAAATMPEVRAVVADSSFATLDNIAAHSITHFTDLPEYPFGPLAVVFAGWIVDRDVGDDRPVDAIARYSGPVLIIQGGADDIAYPDEDGRALYDACVASHPTGACEWWLVPGAAHVGAHDHAAVEYEARILAFLDRAFRAS